MALGSSVRQLTTFGNGPCHLTALRSGVHKSTTFDSGIGALTALGVDWGCLLALKMGARRLTTLRDGAYGDVSMDKIRIKHFKLTSVV